MFGKHLYTVFKYFSPHFNDYDEQHFISLTALIYQERYSKQQQNSPLRKLVVCHDCFSETVVTWSLVQQYTVELPLMAIIPSAN